LRSIGAPRWLADLVTAGHVGADRPLAAGGEVSHHQVKVEERGRAAAGAHHDLPSVGTGHGVVDEGRGREAQHRAHHAGARRETLDPTAARVGQRRAQRGRGSATNALRTSRTAGEGEHHRTARPGRESRQALIPGQRDVGHVSQTQAGLQRERVEKRRPAAGTGGPQRDERACSRRRRGRGAEIEVDDWSESLEVWLGPRREVEVELRAFARSGCDNHDRDDRAGRKTPVKCRRLVGGELASHRDRVHRRRVRADAGARPDHVTGCTPGGAHRFDVEWATISAPSSRVLSDRQQLRRSEAIGALPRALPPMRR